MFFTRDPLDQPLATWPDGSPLTVRHMLRSVQIKGITGSGKSSGSLKFLVDALVRHPKATMLIIAQKPEERAFYQDVFARARRSNDLLIVEEGSENRCNFIDTEMKAGVDARGLTEFITTLGEALQLGQTGGGRDNDRFWRMLEERIIYNSVEAIRQGTDSVTAPMMLDFLTTARYTPAQLSKERPKNEDGSEGESLYEKWVRGFHFQTMTAAGEKQKTAIEASDWHVVKAFWGAEFPTMDDKPRSSGLAGVMNTLHTANTGLTRLMTSTDSKISPAVFDKGKSVLINFPFSNYGPTGRYISGGWKYLTQKHVLRRHWKPDSYFNVIVLDEFQESVTEFDARYLAQCRSHGGGLLCATQTIHSEYGAISGAGHHKADSLLSNFGHHIYHLADAKTEEYASKLLGLRKQVLIGTSSDPSKNDPWDVLMGRAGVTVSCNEQWLPILQPGTLMSSLRTGGPQCKYIVDGLVLRPGEPFVSGENFLWVAFRQR